MLSEGPLNRAALEDWYRRVMLNGAPIPEGVTVNEDGRADQACVVCDEWVDAFGSTFTATHCSRHMEGTDT